MRIVGLTVAAAGFPAPLGAICRIHREQGSPVDAAVVGFQGEETLLLAYGDLAGVRRGNRVTLLQSVPAARVGDRLLGRVLDGRGRFIDNLPAPARPHRVPLHGTPTPPLGRPRIDAPLGTGVRVIDALLTCGKGQRLGIFSGSGVGKSTLLGSNGESQLGRRQRDRAGRRAGPRSARVSRTGSRSRGAGPFGRGGRHERRAGARPLERGLSRNGDRRILSRHRGGTCC